MKDFIEDMPFIVCMAIQIITYIYITKVCFIGKCSIIRNIINFVLSVILFPLNSFLLAAFVPTDYIDVVQSILGDNYFTMRLGITLCVTAFLAIWLGLYIIVFGKKNRTVAAFTYLMFYSIELFGFSIVVMSFVGVVFGITYTIIVVLINFIFCRNILSKIIVLSKEKRQINKAEFYFLTASFILVSITLLASMTWSGGDNDMRLVLNIVFIFTELLMLVTFNTILKDLSYIHEITHQKEEIETAKNEIKTLSVEVMEALAHTIDAKDEYTKGHSIRVAKYSRMIAERMGMSPTECEDIYYMGLLHDLGKIGVPNEIINSPGPLTDEQYAVIKIHPGLGYEILSEIKSRPDLVTGARWHHERYDGKGYPDRKSGEEIPLMARIIAVADSYDAMTSNRSYRKYLPQEKVKSELEKNSGSQFDPEIAGYMIRIIDEDKDYKLHE